VGTIAHVVSTTIQRLAASWASCTLIGRQGDHRYVRDHSQGLAVSHELAHVLSDIHGESYIAFHAAEIRKGNKPTCAVDNLKA
jgi:hypothetical protein